MAEGRPRSGKRTDAGVSRRQLFAMGAAWAGAGLGAAVGLEACSGVTAGGPGNAGTVEFRTPLRIPQIASSIVDSEGTRHFELTMKSGDSHFLPGKSTPTWGFNSPYLGPTLRARRGESVAIHIANRLPEPSTVHWHGMELPAIFDGGPHQTIPAGGTWDPTWDIDQGAATLWYHPHPMGRTAQHVYRGLAGIFVIDDDDQPDSVPHRYGVDDIPLVVQDKRFNDDGTLSEKTVPTFGIMGQDILINGTRGPTLRVTSRAVRLRILNASNARMFHIGIADGRPMTLVATDSGLLPEPRTIDRVPLSPAERAEVVVEFTPGETVMLRSFSGDNGIDSGDFDLLKITAAGVLDPSSPLPDELPGPSPIAPPASARVRTFTLDGHDAINGKEMDMNRIDEIVPLGAHEIWEVTNPVYAHNFHIHNAGFRVLDAAGEVPSAFRDGRKDTVFVAPKSTVRLAVEFGQYADPTHPYMYHCHILRHEDAGMMGQFVMVESGGEESAGTRLGG